MATKGTKTIVSMSIDTGAIERIDEMAAIQGYSRSRMIEQLVLGGLEGQEMVVKAFANPTLLKAFASVFSDRTVLRAMAEAVTEKVGSKQLELFNQTMGEMAGELERVKRKVAKKSTRPRRKKASK